MTNDDVSVGPDALSSVGCLIVGDVNATSVLKTRGRQGGSKGRVELLHDRGLAWVWGGEVCSSRGRVQEGLRHAESLSQGTSQPESAFDTALVRTTA